MDNSNATTEASVQRSTGRGTRAVRISQARGTQSERQSSPREKSPTSKSPDKEQSRPIRGSQNNSRGTRTTRPRPRGRGRVMRRINRPRQQNFRRRLERAQNAARNPRGMRRGFRQRFGFRRPMRRVFGRRSVFIKGFPKNMTENVIRDMLRKEGRLLRVTLLKDSRGESRGIAFAEFQYPRDALKVVQNYRGRRFNGNIIFVAFKREINRFRNNNYPRFFDRNRNNRPFNNYRPGFNPNRFQGPMRPIRNVIRGRRAGRGRGRGF